MVTHSPPQGKAGRMGKLPNYCCLIVARLGRGIRTEFFQCLMREFSMHDITIAHFSDADQRGVVNVILPIQQQEFGIVITEADQPDLHQHRPILPDRDQRLLGGAIKRRKSSARLD